MKARLQFLLITLLVAIFAAPVMAESQEYNAQKILKAMSDYVSSQETIKLTFD